MDLTGDMLARGAQRWQYLAESVLPVQGDSVDVVVLPPVPYLGELDLGHGGPTGSRGGNSAYRLAGVWDRVVVCPELEAALASLGGQGVMLIDDLVDSRWTVTVAGRALRRAGAGAVLPLVLGQAG